MPPSRPDERGVRDVNDRGAGATGPSRCPDKASRTDAPKCMSGQQPARTGQAPAPAAPPGTCSKRLIRRVRSAGVFPPLWPAVRKGSHGRVRFCVKPHAAALCLFSVKGAGRDVCDMRCDTHRAAGAVKRPAFRTSLSGNGRETTEDRRALEPDKTTGR